MYFKYTILATMFCGFIIYINQIYKPNELVMLNFSSLAITLEIIAIATIDKTISNIAVLILSHLSGNRTYRNTTYLQLSSHLKYYYCLDFYDFFKISNLCFFLIFPILCWVQWYILPDNALWQTMFRLCLLIHTRVIQYLCYVILMSSLICSTW